MIEGLNMEITTQTIVEKLNVITTKKLKYNKLLNEIQQELEQSDLYKRIEEGKKIISELELEEKELKDTGKFIMLDAGLKKFESIDGSIAQLNKKPWKLIIEDNDKIPQEYIKEKTTKSIDKKTLKEDIKQWVIIEWVSISQDYELVIKMQ